MSVTIGLDVGGTKVAAARLDGQGLHDHCQQPTALSSTEALIDQFVELVDQAAAGEHFDAVGIGVPSVVRFATGEVTSSANIPLAGVGLRKLLADRLGVEVFVDNDATVATFAEAHDENYRLVARNLVMITLGTGVGSGIVIDGHIFRGATGGAGEIGHTLIAVPSERDIPFATSEFPQAGSLEALAAGRALDRLAEEAAVVDRSGALGRLVADGGVAGAQAAVDAARDGDPVAAVVVKRWAHAVGIGIANAVNTFDPEEVVIGGGAAAAGELLLGPAKEIAEGYILPGLRGLAKVRMARFKAEAGVLGAALLARDELER